MPEPILTQPLMAALKDELAKTAGAAEALMTHLRRAGTQKAIGGGLGSGLGLGLGAGALIGGVRAGKDSYDRARAGGQNEVVSGLNAIGGGLGGALRGAGKGALIGAGAGALAGAALPTQTLRGTRILQKADNVAGSLSNFGQRQVHSVSGWKPGGAMRSVERIGEGAAPARAELAAARASGDAKAVARAEKGLGSMERAQEMGLTSLPGLAKSVGEHGIFRTIGAGAKSQWAGAGPKTKALMVGLPAWSAYSAATTPDGPGAPGRGERIGRLAGSTLGGMAAPLSLAGGIALSTALERGGGAVGKGFDKLRARRAPVQQPQVPQEAVRPLASEPGDVGQHAVEHVYGTGVTGAQGGLE